MSHAAEISPGLLLASTFGDRAHLQHARLGWFKQSCLTGLVAWRPRDGGSRAGAKASLLSPGRDPEVPARLPPAGSGSPSWFRL